MRCVWFQFWLPVAFAAISVGFPVQAQDDASEETREAAIIQRFVAVLEKSPRRGTALDKVYAFHLERGSLDSLISEYRDRASQLAKDAEASGDQNKPREAATCWMIVGLFDTLRGEDPAAAKAYLEAERLDASNSLASFYLGQSFQQTGQFDKAIEAFERAIQRQPSRTDLLDIFQSLGRIYQRTARTDKALAAWNRLEEQFPNDDRVQEQIATTLLEEEVFAAALPRFEKLAKSAKDRNRRAAFQMEAADIKIRLGKTADALQEFERLLSQLNPDHWLYRDVRRRIEAVFLRSEDRAGLTAYYEAWIATHPEDLDVISRLARLLAGLGRDADSRQWLERALKAAPSNRELRLTLINQLLDGFKYAEAAAHYEQLDKFEPNHPDTLREWGRVLLKDTTRTASDRKQAAASVWRRLVDARPKDALVATQLAELFRHAEMTDEALEQYQRAVQLAPEAVQYREYLGEYYHSLGRKDEALSIWQRMADGEAKTAPNVARLAEVLAGYGYVDEAITANIEACRLDPRDFTLHLKLVDLLVRADRHVEALDHLTHVKKLVATDEEHEAWLQRDLRVLDSAGQLKARIVEMTALAEQTSNEQSGKADQDLADHLFWLARAYEASGQSKLAVQAVTRASELAPRSIRILRASARLLQANRNLLAAAEINARLATIDRRFRTEYLKEVATLERELGRREKALQAGRDLINAAPGNPDVYEFFSQLCFQLGEPEEGLQGLRRAVRVNSGDTKALIRLATALVERNRVSEATELFWRVFDKSSQLEERLDVVQRMANASIAAPNGGQQDRLFERLERLRREPGQKRELTLCLAQAYQEIGETEKAQRELETLLTEETRDTSLLAQLRNLAEKRHDLASASRYQRQLWQITQDSRDRFRLAELLLKNGEAREAIELLSASTETNELTVDVFKLLDGLYESRQFEPLLARLKPLRERFPDNWELLYREGLALERSKPDEAIKRFDAILALNRPDDEPALAPAAALAVAVRLSPVRLELVDRMQDVSSIQYAMQLASSSSAQAMKSSSLSSNRQARMQMWRPRDYGSVRLAAWGHLTQNSLRRPGGLGEVFGRLEYREQKDSNRAMLEELAVYAFAGDVQRKTEQARKIATHPDAGIDAKIVYFQAVASRRSAALAAAQNRSGAAAANVPPPQPLDTEQLDELHSIYQEISQRSELIPWNISLLNGVMQELTIAGRSDDAAKLVDDALERASTHIEIVMLVSGTSILANLAPVQGMGATARVIRLLDRWAEFQDNPGAKPLVGSAASYYTHLSSTNFLAQRLQRYIDFPNVARSPEDVLAIWRRYLRIEAHALAQRLKQREQRTNVQILNWQSGNEVFHFQPNAIYHQYAGLMLFQLSSKFSGQIQQLMEVFETEAQNVELTREERLLWKYGLGYLQWQKKDQELALKTFTDAVEQMPERVDLRLNLVRMCELAGLSAQALEIVESVTPDSPDVQLEREQAALRLSLAIGNTDRAKIAAERLFGLKVPTDELVSLAEQMIRLEMIDHAEAMLARAATPSQNDLRAHRALMDIHLSRGRKDQAAQFALAILTRLDEIARSPQTNSGRITGTVTTIVNAQTGQRIVTRLPQPNIVPNEYRQHAYKVLHETGRLAEMIDEAELKLKESPNSAAIIAKLMAYYTAAGNQTRIDELTLQQLEAELSKPQNRYARAMKLLELGRADESVEQIRILIETEPVYFSARCRDAIFRFENKNEIRKLAKMFEQADWKAYNKHPEVLPMIVEQLAAGAFTNDVATRLFLKNWDARPERRIEILQQSQDEQWWKLGEVASSLPMIPIPLDAAGVSQQWSAFGRVMKQKSDSASVMTILNRILNIVAERGELDAMAVDVEKGLKQWQDWTAGRVLLALIDLRRNRVESAAKTLDEMLPELRKTLANNSAPAWEIGQELARHETSFDVGIRYYELAIHDRGVEVWTSTNSPAKALIKTLVEKDRRADARRLLIELVPSIVRRGVDSVKSPTTVDLHTAQWIGRELRALDYPIDAMLVYQAALDRSAQMKIGGYDPRVELQSSLAVTFGELKADSLAEYLTSPAADTTKLDSQLFLSSREPLRARVESRWTSLLSLIAEQPESLARTLASLRSYRQKHPNDLATLVMAGQLAAVTKSHENLVTSAGVLLQYMNDSPMPELSISEREAFQQRETAAHQIALWLIAKECLRQKALEGQGTRLAERALAAARQQTDKLLAIAILNEWIEIVEKTEDAATADRLKAQREAAIKSAEKPLRQSRPDIGF